MVTKEIQGVGPKLRYLKTEANCRSPIADHFKLRRRCQGTPSSDTHRKKQTIFMGGVEVSSGGQLLGACIVYAKENFTGVIIHSN